MFHVVNWITQILIYCSVFFLVRGWHFIVNVCSTKQFLAFVDYLLLAPHTSTCVGRATLYFAVAKWIFESRIIIHFPPPLFLCVRLYGYVVLWIVVAGFLWTKQELCHRVSQMNHLEGGRRLLQREKHSDIKDLKEIKKIDTSPMGTRGKTCQQLYHL